MHFQVEYYNKLWKDWLPLDQCFYLTEHQARQQALIYTDKHLDTQTRIVTTDILRKKPSKKTVKKITVKKI